ncbi:MULTISPECIES: phosphopyruvate hydratase [unclassified Nocardioides]|uniref:phosphopyruvate hydratase n=1 Tax=unclassified Nocardioides TaxID=2615069 RepID=UPI0006FC7B20|nr:MULTISPECIES: phosphopyruvate hydratase [unclassified Nocardioides]KRA37679.1 phosphopyruvate hydratase [Nocardioides sp. Root614]KRA91639.1 phosphopyruvate hydratase [Nocardioides sp. Root682]
MTDVITEVRARRVWDSRGRPTVEVEITTASGARGRAIAPAGASMGSGEATDLRDGGTRLGGLDVRTAVANVKDAITPKLLGLDVADQSGIDQLLDDLDPSPTRSVLGGNATVATSLAVLHAAAASVGLPTWRHLDPQPVRIPRPQVQIIGGGAHAARRVDLQDFMVVPISATRIDDALEQIAEVYLSVGALFRKRGPVLGVADEGGHWPAVDRNEQALELLTEGIAATGLVPGIDLAISLDIAASEFEQDGRYTLASEDRTYERDAWLDVLEGWLSSYPIVAIEDPAGEHDPTGMVDFTARAAGRSLVVGDDFLVTDPARIRAAAALGACDTALIKVNQAGTVTRTAAAHGAARDAGWATIVSARSGETEDISVAHLAVGWGADILKVGSITRSERTAKWNELIRIDDELGGVPMAPFPLPTDEPADELADEGETP